MIRIGLKWRVEVLFEDVTSAEILRGGTILPKRKDLLRAVVLGDARYLLTLARPAVAERPLESAAR